LIITFAFGARSTIRRVCPSIFNCQRPQNSRPNCKFNREI